MEDVVRWFIASLALGILSFLAIGFLLEAVVDLVLYLKKLKEK